MSAPTRRFIERAFPVRTYDIDFAGVVNNIVYIRWLEDLRLALMEEVYPIDRALRDDIAPILLETQIQYARAVTIQDALVGRMWVTDMEKIRWHVAAEFIVAGKVHAKASQIGLFVKLSTKRPIAPPLALRAAYMPETVK